MKDRVDKSMGIVTLLVEGFPENTPADPLRLAEREARKKRNCLDASGNSPDKILPSRCACKKIRRVKSS
jgi:hypothetical protein